MPSLARVPAFALLALLACDPGQPHRDVTDTVAGVRYAIRLDQLRRQSIRPGEADQWRLEARVDGFAGSQVRPDHLKTTVFVLRQDGPDRLGCGGEAGFTHTPLPDAEATRQQLMDTCESLRILR